MPDSNWDAIYKNSEVEQLPWYHSELDHDIKKELELRKIKSGTFWDLGTGPGTQAAALAKLGFKVTATDISNVAIEKAKKCYKDITFVSDDITKSKLQGHFDYIFDRGCFHSLDPDEWKIYINTVNHRLRKGGLLFLKCFSIKEKTVKGPYRFSIEEIDHLFRKDFVIEKIVETEFKGTLHPNPKALFIVLKKK